MQRSICALVSLALLGVGCTESDQGPKAGSGLSTESNTQAVTAKNKCPRGATVEGIDVSSYQGSINWNAVKASGRQFAIARINAGSSVDSYFSRNWAGIKNAGMIRGAYQYYYPSLDATQQANLVVSQLGRLGPGDLPAMLDVETTSGYSAAAIISKISTWLDIVERGTGKRPIIYTGAYFWDGNIGSNAFSGYPLSIAWYGTNCPGVPNAWDGASWKFHQYSETGSVSGISGNVDLEVFNGSLSDLQAFAGGSSREFDAAFYLNYYPDLKAAFGSDSQAAANHWLTYGIKEGRRSSREFDVNFYLNYYSDLRAAFGSDYQAALNHWLTYGINEGRRSSPEFDIGYYLSNYSDLQAAFGANNYKAGYDHWFAYGVSEGRRSSREFDLGYYLNSYPDLKAAFGSNYKLAYEHWFNYGLSEGRRSSSEFDVGFYLNNYSDLKAAFGNDYRAAFNHWLTNGINEGRKSAQ